METRQGSEQFVGRYFLLDLPMRDGNPILDPTAVACAGSFRPSYEGWKPVKSSEDGFELAVLLDLPMRDGNPRDQRPPRLP